MTQPFGVLAAFNVWTTQLEEALIEFARRDFPVLVDSGAFAAWTRQEVISLDAYCRTLQALPFTPWGYFNLDVIGDPRASLANEMAMRARGMSPFPVWTRTADAATLKKMLDRSPVVGVGGLVASRNPNGFMKLATRIAGHGRLHFLGRSSGPIVFHLRPRSTDSSRWVRARKFGYISLWLGRGREERILFGDVHHVRHFTHEQSRALAGYGYTATQLRSSSLVRYYLGIRNQIAAATALHQRTGAQFFFAVGGHADVRNILAEYDALQRGEWQCPPL